MRPRSLLVLLIVGGCVRPHSDPSAERSDAQMGSRDGTVADAPVIDSSASEVAPLADGAIVADAPVAIAADAPVAADVAIAPDAPSSPDLAVSNIACAGPSAQACGNCGTQSRVCDTGTGVWSAWSACTGEGPCAATATQSCGTAGGSQSCGADCKWGICSCSGPTSQTCNCTGTATRTCNDGTWSAFGACAGGSNTGSDPQNCGACGHVCTGGTCSGGACACPTCPACRTCDASTGSCVAATGVPCPVSHGGGTCDAQGNCQTRSCDPGFVMCAGVCTAESDHTCGPNCDDCYLPPGTATPHIDLASCLNHACKITQCNSEGPFCAACSVIADFGDCNNAWRDGCEVDLTADNNNCGGCGQSCSVCQPGSLETWCQVCTSSPCLPCKKHPHSMGPNIGCGP